LSDATSAALTVDEIHLQAITRLVVTPNGSSSYRFDQYGASDNPTIYAISGTTIAFDLAAVTVSHPFLIQTSGGVNYDTGLVHVSITGVVSTGTNAQGKTSGTLYWKIPSSITGNYLYKCSVHTGSMVGVIAIQSSTSPSFTGTVTVQQLTEVLNTKTAATGTVAHDLSTGAIFYHSSISANFTANFTNVPTTNDRTVAVVLVLNQGATARIPSAVQIDSVAQNILWQGGLIPTGTANRVDVVSFTLIRTGSAWTVIGALTTYGAA
jgi:plastocyanin